VLACVQAYFTLASVMGGVIMTSVIIGSASTALQSLDAEKEVRRQRMDKVMSYLKRRKIPTYFQKVRSGDILASQSPGLSQLVSLPLTLKSWCAFLLRATAVGRAGLLRLHE
jgi:hypothetical protein